MSGGEYFDQREALHAAGQLRPSPSTSPSPLPLIAVGRNGPQGWHVALLQGAAVLAELTPDAATRLAADMLSVVDLLEHGPFFDAGDERGGR